jgi:hypothetical protein
VNIQEYISSGIVETCVLGLASDNEQLEFEQLCSIHAELNAAREAFEISLERTAMESAVAPPAGLKEKIWSDIGLAGDSSGNHRPSPVRAVDTPLTPVRSLTFARFMAAASVLLLVASTLLNFYFYNQYKSSLSKYNELVVNNQQMAANDRVMQTKLQTYEHSFDIIRDTNMSVVAMKGQAAAPQSFTTVYWDKQTRDVYLLVNNLPRPVAGKQYQLWAIVDGKPVDAGVLDTNAGPGLVKMKNIPRAQVFAITLEKLGGSATPDLKSLFVLGQV